MSIKKSGEIWKVVHENEDQKGEEFGNFGTEKDALMALAMQRAIDRVKKRDKEKQS